MILTLELWTSFFRVILPKLSCQALFGRFMAIPEQPAGGHRHHQPSEACYDDAHAGDRADDQ